MNKEIDLDTDVLKMMLKCDVAAMGGSCEVHGFGARPIRVGLNWLLRALKGWVNA
jgi:hypothetical protein